MNELIKCTGRNPRGESNRERWKDIPAACDNGVIKGGFCFFVNSKLQKVFCGVLFLQEVDFVEVVLEKNAGGYSFFSQTFSLQCLAYLLCIYRTDSGLSLTGVLLG